MTRYFEILIEKESILIDLTLDEIRSVPHETVSAIEYDKFIVQFDYTLQSKKDQLRFGRLIELIIRRKYPKVVSIIEVEPLIKNLE